MLLAVRFIPKIRIRALTHVHELCSVSYLFHEKHDQNSSFLVIPDVSNTCIFFKNLLLSTESGAHKKKERATVNRALVPSVYN